LEYEICGVSFVSAEPFPELSPSTSPETKPCLRLRRVSRIRSAGQAIRPAVTWTQPDGAELLVSSKTDNGYLLHFTGLADFFIDQIFNFPTMSEAYRIAAFDILKQRSLPQIAHLKLAGASG